MNNSNLAAQYKFQAGRELCEAGNATLNFLLCLELALMSFFSQTFGSKAYKLCLVTFADLCYINSVLKKSDIQVFFFFCVGVKEDRRMSDVGPLPHFPQRAAAGQWH